jgi:hypothetical protein
MKNNYKGIFSKAIPWEGDMGIREMANWLCDWNVKPDFKQIVEKSLALFGVFTGVTLSFYIKDFLFGNNIPRLASRTFPYGAGFWFRLP